MNIIIRQEKENDVKETYTIHKAAFRRDNESRLVDLLRKSNTFIPELSLVAQLNNKIIGHILFTKIKIIAPRQAECISLALAPLAVLPEYHHIGIGGQLIKFGLEKAKEMRYRSVIVLGHKHYYPKFGFVPTERWNISAPFEVAKDVFMGIELIEDGLKNVSGVVHYPKEFEVV